MDGRGPAAKLEGCVALDKPSGWTSHDVVARCRKVLGERKIGHAGTLDPDATGVLVLGVGRATRLLGFATALPKSYVGEVVLGIETESLDASGQVTATYDMSAVTIDQLRAAAVHLTGRIDQVPPMVSAVKVGGTRLHELARAGIEVERAPRPVEVRRFDIAPGRDPSYVEIAVDCSSGTYVRVLAADLGKAVGGGAHLRALRRVAVGPFDESGLVALDELDADDLLPPRALVAHLEDVVVEGESLLAVRHGRPLELDALGATANGPWAVLDNEGGLLAVYEPADGGRAKPAVVLRPASSPRGPQ